MCPGNSLIAWERKPDMFRIIFGIFIALHGLVHLLYSGQSLRYFELKPGMTWPDGAWAFSGLLGNETTRKLAGILLIVAAIGLVASGIGTLANQDWWRPAVMGAAALSCIVYVLLWNGKMQDLDGQGVVGLLINAAILAVIFVLQRALPE
jgi:hypothetical protein